MTHQYELFRLIDHACRVCGGRVLHRVVDAAHQQVRCSECGAGAILSSGSDKPWRHICYCGATLMSGVDAWLRCKRNDYVTPEQSQEVVVVHVKPEPKPYRKPDKVVLHAPQPGEFEW